MRKIIFTLSISVFFISNIFAVDVCSSFVSAEEWKYVDTIERDGMCFIDEQTNLDRLLFEGQKKYYDEEFQKEFIVLSKGKTFAVMVSSDMLYTLEQGNEAWWTSGIVAFFRPTRTGDQASISPHHGRTMRENSRLREKNSRLTRENNEYKARERERKHREWQERADRWSGERGVSPR